MLYLLYIIRLPCRPICSYAKKLNVTAAQCDNDIEKDNIVHVMLCAKVR